MNCPDFDTLMMLLDGELRDRKLKEVSEHVLSCSRCRGLIDSQRMLEASWRDNIVIPDSEEFRSMEWNIFRKINRRSHWRTFVPAVAAIIVVLLGVKLILTDGPSMDRITDLSRVDRVEVISDADQLMDERTESLVSAVESLDPEPAVESETLTESGGRYVSTGDVTVEITGDMEGYSFPDEESVLSQPVAEEEYPGESFRGISSFGQDDELQNIVGGTATDSTSRSGGSSGLSGYGEECEESETDFGTVFMDDAVEDICQEEMNDETQDNWAAPQSSESYSGFHETSGHDVDYWKSDIVVELVFDADGQPDSITALLLDSLLAGWSDYILSGYRDTVLVIPLADIQELFIDGSTVPAETIE